MGREKEKKKVLYVLVRAAETKVQHVRSDSLEILRDLLSADVVLCVSLKLVCSLDIALQL